MALASRTHPSGTERRPSSRRPPRRTFLGSTVGKKTVMAVSGLVLLAYLVAHVIGNLKVFLGPDEFNAYGHWLRTMGAPVLHHGWGLWIVRVGLLTAVIAHGVSAYRLSRLDRRARPVRYVHKRRRASYATRTMRWGGVIIALFVVWHLLDLTTLTVNGNAQPGHPYENVVATFSTWYGNAVYLVAVLAVGLHVRHGFWSAAQTLGAGSARRDRALRAAAGTLALILTAGFASVPVAVMTGVVS
ncbi:succinate dehydrogenase cytochrome b subunit [Streptomyces sudanensis]|uniref:succinate dehydrogenase cytochrome b subunit n=1 Tax=Streptomyces sudanensis TaxID=436397 RepID=UPI0020CFA6D5|nr:succinate dehydrogenase cytochrome b subunit [Streptomyces sudanensis]MCP9956371.1 succinate dehydrogenase cytochrome b subunit [Streptomyces sudanensis]MCP9985578.1 succinate dehydrogenase cytochrome b subunit [Streptomyces sudanensis]MCQ0003012.1 succinate dehydrogenase cytochrome b subunit [Streptomyces sudanensis]